MSAGCTALGSAHTTSLGAANGRPIALRGGGGVHIVAFMRMGGGKHVYCTASRHGAIRGIRTRTRGGSNTSSQVAHWDIAEFACMILLCLPCVAYLAAPRASVFHLSVLLVGVVDRNGSPHKSLLAR